MGRLSPGPGPAAAGTEVLPFVTYLTIRTSRP
jgi:hypothetical protein